MYKKILLFGGLSLGGVAVGAGISLGVVLPKALKAQEGLTNFISKGGTYNSIANKDKVNIVALGDSETAGYNGIMGRDYLSYADFLAQSFKNAGKLGSYNNFAFSGLRLSDFGKYVFEDPNKVRILKNADEILLTIGANDILAIINLLGIPFGSALQILNGSKKISSNSLAKIIDDSISKTSSIQVDLNDNNLTTIRESFYSNPMGIDVGKDIFLKRKKIFNEAPELSFSKEDSYNLISNTLNDFGKIMGGEGQYLINLDRDWYPKVFDLVQRSMATLARDIHKVAPHAQIQLLGHAFPFRQFPDKVENGKKKELDNTSLKDNFLRLLESMKKGMETSLGSNDFVTYTSVDKIKEFSSSIKKIDFSSDNKFYGSFKKNPMPNITDIHPSTYGHELIAKNLFRKLAKENGISSTDIEKFTMKSFDVGTSDDFRTSYDETNWIREDEIKSKVLNLKSNALGIHTISDPGSLYKDGLETFVKPLLDFIIHDIQIPSNKTLTSGELTFNILNSNIKSITITFGIILGIAKSKINKNIQKKIDPSTTLNTSVSLSKPLNNKESFVKIINNLEQEKNLPIIQQDKQLCGIINIIEMLKNLVFKSKLGLQVLKDNINNPKISRIEQYAIAQFTLSNIIGNIFKIQSSIQNMGSIFF